MDEGFENIKQFSRVIHEISTEIPEKGITLKEFLDIIGKRGLFMSCMILTAPFLLPVSIPGMSIPFGSTIFLISLSIMFDRPILLPKRIINRHISKRDMELILKEILNILNPLEKFISPRLSFLVNGRTSNRINGFMVAFGSILLVTPIIAPLGDFLPSYGILFISLGTLEGDGYLVLAGYATVIGTAIYYVLIFAIGITIIIIIASHLGIYF